MDTGDRVTDEQAQQMYDLINERKEMLVTGVKGMQVLKQVLAYAVRKAGVSIEWDPTTPAALRERMTIMSLSALQWSLAGAAAGLAVGVCTNRPGTWAGIGAGIAALLGMYQGHCAVTSGWRLRGYHDESGVEYVEIRIRALPSPASG
ncbi:hypothetical protein [Nannocystis punicea]|uniref:DUF2892 domain-containing protein n=1 Tax=Nannocystis punicea TaxID=2995304 RepID=A0ABY7HAS5_9BACT|nr:hypothetical protein [Nannocystis poenicansa]WAS96372.1 hypothetical protein O0S08_09445 [Nannocystis poenicansa]